MACGAQGNARSQVDAVADLRGTVDKDIAVDPATGANLGTGKNFGAGMHVGAVTNGDASSAEFFNACRATLGFLLQKMLMLELFESVEQ